MSIQTQTITADELLRMPPDGFRYELVRGELRKMSPSGHKHGEVAVRFTWRLAQRVEPNGLGKVYAAETGFLLSSNPDTVRAPDVAFVSRKRIEEVGDVKGFWPGAPDLAVEVISPGDSYAEVEEKVFEWLDAGSRVVLVLNPQKRTVTLYRSRAEITLLTENDKLAVEDVVPGWLVEVKELFG
jgi:Uma2 family endonuclease